MFYYYFFFLLSWFRNLQIRVILFFSWWLYSFFNFMDRYIEPNLIPIENNNFLNNIFNLSFYQINSVCNDFGKILDLVFVSDVNKWIVIRSEPVTSPEDRYHSTLKIIINVYTAHTSANKHISSLDKYFCFPRTNYTELNGILPNVNWDSALAINNFDKMVCHFYPILHNAIILTKN